jgi:hypothetical protein
MKATLQEYHYHRRICARGDPTAFAELAAWLYDPLVQDVRKRAGNNADPTLVEEAVGQALLNYHDKPESFDPDRGGLQGYLVMAAYRDFQNAQAREHRLREHQISLFDPTFRERDALESQETIDSQLRAEELWGLIDEVFPDPTERRIVELILDHVRSPEAYAQVLNLGALPDDERLRQVRLAKYRITRRLRRKLTRRLHHTGEA